MGIVCIQLVRYFLQAFFNNRLAVDLDVVMDLGDVNPIKHVEITLVFDVTGETVI